MIRSIVSHLADAVVECGDGVQALSAYAVHRPGWVLMDLKLPGMDGIETTRLMRRVDAGARIAIVTNYDDAALRIAARTAGASGYVCKTNLLDLLDLLEAPGSR